MIDNNQQEKIKPNTRFADTLRRVLDPTGPLRRVFDVAWLASFAVLLALLLLRDRASSSADSGELLDLMEGAVRQGLFVGDRRVGTLISSVVRKQDRWLLRTRFLPGDGSGQAAASTRLVLHPDLSLSSLAVDADLSRLLSAATPATALLGGLPGMRRISVHGDCELETGICRVKGRIGTEPVDLNVTAGRGPVLTSAVYPLLARGSLGRRVELSIFDPLTLGRRIITYEVEGTETLRLRSGQRAEAVRVRRDLEGLATWVWLDPRGLVLREDLPVGIQVEHEAALPLSEEEKK